MNGEDDREARSTYHSPVREEQAKLTRERIANAARTLFLENGYARTTLRQVAEHAEVSDQTIYATYRNKSGLLIAIIDSLDLTAGADQIFKDLAAAEGDSARQLGLFVAYDRRLFGREGSTLRILRDASATEPEMARAYRDGRNRSREIHLRYIQQWTDCGDLHQELTADQASDLYTAMSSIDTFTYLVDERGWSPEEWEQHIFRMLASAILRSHAERS